MTTPERVIAHLAEHDIAFVDFRFTDTPGREHHLTVPAHTVNGDLFETGLAFDGSSMPGWASIEASDMVLLPDATT
ncbi:MAG TPA: glutamine synthetase, partial [Burkholderiaceae bacterium]|nr:glutamine synthetase [Burkholderiaceae bacterium]